MVDRCLGHYRILEPLGAGGMGSVYLAEDTRLRRRVALKVVNEAPPPHPASQRQLLEEARTAAELNHPHICTIHEVGESEDGGFIVMELVEGRSLQAVLQEGALPVERAVRFGVQIADALAHAHAHGIVHRDLKAGNVMVTPDDRIKLLDFGLAVRLPSARLADATTASARLDEGGSLAGTLPYMSPEVLEGHPADDRSDIWALGVILHEAVHGRRPFHGRTAFELTSSILRDPPPELPRDLPAGLRATIDRCLAKKPVRRYQGAGEVKAALEVTLSSPGTVPAPTPAGPRTTDTPGGDALASAIPVSSRTLLAGTATAVLAALAVLAHAYWTAGPAELAVLPFSREASPGDRTHLGDRVADELIARFQQRSGITVAPLATVKGLDQVDGTTAMAEALSVDWVLRGTVSGAGTDIAVDWQLQNADGRLHEEGTLRGTEEGFGDLTAHLTETVAAALGVDASPVETPGRRVRSDDPVASARYLEAEALAHGWDVPRNLVEAIDLYREALGVDPDFAAARAGLAMALLRRYQNTLETEQLREAEEAARRSVEDNPDLPEAQLARGTVAMIKGESMEAERILNRALTLAPGNDAAFRSLARLQTRSGRHDEARRNYKTAIALRPGYWENHYLLGSLHLFYLGEPLEAEGHLETAHRLHPQGSEPLLLLGNSHYSRARLETAKSYYERALLRSGNVDAYANLGLIHYLQGDYDQALDNWLEIIEDWTELMEGDASSPLPSHHSNVGDALRQLGELERARRHYDRALEGFEEVLAANPDDFYRAERSIPLASMGRCEEARSEMETALDRYPESASVRYYGLQAAARCEDRELTMQHARALIADHQALLEMWLDPDLEILRRTPSVRDPLEKALREEGLLDPSGPTSVAFPSSAGGEADASPGDRE